MKRYKNNVGKTIGGFVYFHKDYIDDINPQIHQIIKEAEGLKMKFNVIKYPINPKTFKQNAITFINCPAFDDIDEPYIIEYWRYDMATREWTYKWYNVLNRNVPVYHHKWLFVKDDYKGFDVEISKKRSEWVDSLDVDKSKIGYLHQWFEIVRNPKFKQIPTTTFV